MWIDIIITIFLVVGGFFTLVGSIGLIKLSAPMSRLHAPTKSSTLGVGSLLMASMIYSFAHGEGSLHEMLVMAFLFVTAPISGNFIAKVHLHRHRETMDLPRLEGDNVWATHQPVSDANEPPAAPR
jgi:multicomponent K+:H+ antiporter subunit G